MNKDQPGIVPLPRGESPSRKTITMIRRDEPYDSRCDLTIRLAFGTGHILDPSLAAMGHRIDPVAFLTSSTCIGQDCSFPSATDTRASLMACEERSAQAGGDR